MQVLIVLYVFNLLSCFLKSIRSPTWLHLRIKESAFARIAWNSEQSFKHIHNSYH